MCSKQSMNASSDNSLKPPVTLHVPQISVIPHSDVRRKHFMGEGGRLFPHKAKISPPHGD